MTTRGTWWRAPVVIVLGALVLSGCGGSEPMAEPPARSPKPPAAPASTLKDGTTAPGTHLEVGDVATVRYPANAKKGSLVSLRVKSIEKGKITALDDFDPDAKIKRSHIYYVRVTVTNVGDGDLSGQPLMLYGEVSDTLVVPPVQFGSTFEPCDYRPLPKGFEKPEQATVCIVMLVPKKGTLKAVQFRAADSADPISWRRR